MASVAAPILIAIVCVLWNHYRVPFVYPWILSGAPSSRGIGVDLGNARLKIACTTDKLLVGHSVVAEAFGVYRSTTDDFSFGADDDDEAAPCSIGVLLSDTATPLTQRAVQSLLRSAETTMGAGALPALTVVAVHPNYWSHPTTGALLMTVASWRGAATSGHDDSLWTPTQLGNVLLVPQGTAQCAAYLAQKSFEPSVIRKTVVFIDVGDRFSTATVCLVGPMYKASVVKNNICVACGTGNIVDLCLQGMTRAGLDEGHQTVRRGELRHVGRSRGGRIGGRDAFTGGSRDREPDDNNG